MLEPPFYLDWKFWSFASSFLAIVLSQLPPLRDLLRRGKLEVEAHSRIVIHHKVGNPNANLFVTITNTGGKTLKIKGITLDFQRDNKPIFSMPGQGYHENMSDSEPVLLTPFRLLKGQEWAHLVRFFVPFGRDEDQSYRRLESDLKSNIFSKQAAEGDTKIAIVADDEFVMPLINFFSKRFDWKPGEYQIDLKVEVEPKKASTANSFRFTIYESDSNDLRAVSEEYAIGAGVYFHTPRHNGLSFQLTAKEG